MNGADQRQHGDAHARHGPVDRLPLPRIRSRKVVSRIRRVNLQAMRDSRHEQHADYWAWWGGPFDPKGFGINAANMAIRKLR